MSIFDILVRELRKGTFDKTCTADERMLIRQFLAEFKTFLQKCT